MYSRLQYISQGTDASEHLKNIQLALDAGCTWIQLRMKDASITSIQSTAEEVRLLCNTYQAVLILNDLPSLAKEVDADGVHLGLEDMSIEKAREIIGDNKIIGGTCNTLQDVLKKTGEGCDYIGLGPFRFTTTKANLSPILGIKGYKEIMRAIAQRNLRVPIYAIGGIASSDISELMETGVYGVALSGLITANKDKKYLITQLNSMLHGEFSNC